MTTLEKLWEIAEQESIKTGIEPEYVFESIGLILYPYPENPGYDATPKNTQTFAYTEGDGVHFGLLEIDGKIADDSPVVMTVPMNFDNANMIVGSCLWDFLCLGSTGAYFGNLEQLTYYKKKAIEWIKHPEKGLYLTDDSEPYVEPVALIEYPMTVLVEQLDLNPWTDVEAKLEDLHKKFYSLLEVEG